MLIRLRRSWHACTWAVSDVAYSVRNAALHVWKTLVTKHPQGRWQSSCQRSCRRTITSLADPGASIMSTTDLNFLVSWPWPLWTTSQNSSRTRTKPPRPPPGGGGGGTAVRLRFLPDLRDFGSHSGSDMFLASPCLTLIVTLQSKSNRGRWG